MYRREERIQTHAGDLAVLNLTNVGTRIFSGKNFQFSTRIRLKNDCENRWLPQAGCLWKLFSQSD